MYKMLLIRVSKSKVNLRNEFSCVGFRYIFKARSFSETLKLLYVHEKINCDQVTDVGRVRQNTAIHCQFRLVYSKLGKTA